MSVKAKIALVKAVREAFREKICKIFACMTVDDVEVFEIDGLDDDGQIDSTVSLAFVEYVALKNQDDNVVVLVYGRGCAR